jgi:GAF domain-containing protein
VDLVGADEGWFYILDFGNGVLRRLNPEAGQKTALALQYQLDEVNLLCDAVREGTIKVVGDVKNPSRPHGHHPFHIKKYRSEAAIPLKRGEQVIGAVVLASRIPEAFLEMDIDSLRSFAMLSGSALDQAKLRYYLQHISQAVLRGQDTLQNAVIDAIHELLGKSVALWLLDEASDEFTVPASRGITETFKRKARIKFAGQDDSLLAHAFLTGKPVNCGDLQNPEEGLSVKLDSLLREENWRSTLLVPIFDSEGKPIGVIAIKRDVVGKFSQYEVDFLKNFTSQVAIAFENHRRRLSLSQQLDAFQEIIRTVGIEEADPLPVILEKAALLLGAHYGSFALLDLQKKL